MMKSVSILGLMIFSLVAGIGLTGYSVAQEGDSVLVQKIDALVEQLANLAANENSNSNETNTGNVQLQYASGVSNPTCLDNYQSWPNSLVRKTGVDWDPTTLPIPINLPHKSFLDLNGDGLLDYLHYEGTHSLYSGQFNYNSVQSCVMLNNGVGWDTTYRCVTGTSGSYGNYDIRYYGDCAQI